MKISLNWIGDFVNLDGVSAEEVAELLSMHTAEVEAVEVFGQAIADVVIGEVVSCEQHPDADKLLVTQVAYGAEESAQVVCGATNVRTGLKVAFAPIGSMLPGDFKIKKAKLRGVLSLGMICSERELELSDAHAGIMELNDDVPIGGRLVDCLGLLDHVLELDNKSLTHRPDLWGHYGFAREIAALLGRELKPLPVLAEWPDVGSATTIEVADTASCPLYLGLEIDLGGVPRDASAHLRRRLLAVGQRPVNDVVDLTNYVLQEIGQPTHAFDRDQLAGDEIFVRSAGEDESLRTIDDELRKLCDQDLVIADANRVIAVAGVMGGADSEVGAQTNSILLESASFDPVRVRRSSSRLGLRTEASARFEKSLDPALAEQALRRFALLLSAERPEAKVLSAPARAGEAAAPGIELELDTVRAAKLLSLELSAEEMRDSLQSIGFGCTLEGSKLMATVPSWRATKDVTSAIDLVEEVGRLAGYHLVEATPLNWPVVAPWQDPARKLCRRLEDRVAGAWNGQQTESYSFLDHAWLRRLGLDEGAMLQLTNPVQDGVDLVRTDPIPGLLEQARLNVRERAQGLVFETSKGYFPSAESEPVERHWFAALAWCESGLDADGPGSLFGKGRSLVEDLLDLCSIIPRAAHPGDSTSSWAHPHRVLGFEHGGRQLGLCAQIDPRIVNDCGIDNRDFVAVLLDIQTLVAVQEEDGGRSQFVVPAKMPAIKVDIALALPASVSFLEAETAIRKCGGKILEKLELFDIFSGGSLEKGFRSLAFHAVLRADNRTLCDQDERKFLKKVSGVAEQMGGNLRS